MCSFSAWELSDNNLEKSIADKREVASTDVKSGRTLCPAGVNHAISVSVHTHEHAPEMKSCRSFVPTCSHVYCIRLVTTIGENSLLL
jgi:hypothetical protein